VGQNFSRLKKWVVPLGAPPIHSDRPCLCASWCPRPVSYELFQTLKWIDPLKMPWAPK
jgi:hypothetical protein